MMLILCLNLLMLTFDALFVILAYLISISSVALILKYFFHFEGNLQDAFIFCLLYPVEIFILKGLLFWNELLTFIHPTNDANAIIFSKVLIFYINSIPILGFLSYIVLINIFYYKFEAKNKNKIPIEYH